MIIHNDFQEFLKLLNDHNVEFVIVGGYAVAFHGYVRSTRDIDIFFRNTKENISKILPALRDFGIPMAYEAIQDFQEQGSIIRLGIAPVMIELINEISGVRFEQAWENRIKGTYGDVNVYYISYDDLIENKRESGRPKDLADIDELGGNRK